MDVYFKLNNESVDLSIDIDFIKRETGLLLNNPVISLNDLNTMESNLKLSNDDVVNINKKIEINAKRTKMVRIAKTIALVIGVLILGALIGTVTGPAALLGIGLILNVIVYPFAKLSAYWFILPTTVYKIVAIIGGVIGGAVGAGLEIDRNKNGLVVALSRAQKKKDNALQKVEEQRKQHDQSIIHLHDIIEKLKIRMAAYQVKLDAKYDESNSILHESMTDSRKIWQANYDKAEQIVNGLQKLENWLTDNQQH